MKNVRNIRWSEAVGAKKENTSVLGTGSSFFEELVLFVLCTVLFFGAACGMVESVFTWDIFSAGIVIRVAVVTVLVSVLVELTERLKPGPGGIAKFGIGIIGLFLFFLYLRGESGVTIWDGLRAAANHFLNDWNTYYRSSGRFWVGDVEAILPALRFSVTVLCFLFAWLESIWKKVWLPAVVPCFVLVAELLIGVAPEGISLWALIIGVCAANAAGARDAEFLPMPVRMKESRSRFGKQFVWLPSGLFVLLLCIVVSIAGTSSAQETVDNGKNKMEQMKKETLQAITEWSGWQEIKVAKTIEKAVKDFLEKKDVDTKNIPESNFARLDNSKPEYDEVAVLKVVVDGWQRHGAYLIGFYADTYEDGVWDTDVEAFEKACNKAGFSPQTVAEGVLSLASDRVKAVYGEELSAENGLGKNSGVIQYAKANLIKTYLPYFSQVTAEGVRAEGDGRYVKEKGLTKVPFSFWNYSLDELTTMFHLEEKQLTGRQKEAWELWYEDYLTEQYLDVPDDFTQVKIVAEEIRKSEVDFFRVDGESSVNIDRLNKAYQVAEWMRNHTSYSLDLPELPKGTDPIEFFLGTSRQGYCMHYASASVMLLRELGVPARYVSGYVAGNFKRNPDTLNYEAVVLDSAAHAWVEIYLENFGWLPVEVTNGYSVANERTQVIGAMESGRYFITQERWPDSDNEDVWVNIKPFATPKPTPTPGPTPTPAPDVTDSPADREQENVTEQGEDSESQAEEKTEEKIPQEQTPQSEENAGEEKDFSFDWKYCFMGIPVLLFVAFLLYRIYLNVAYTVAERKLTKKGRYSGNRRQIKQWNRMLYRKLRIKGKFRKRTLRDEEYEEVLQRYKDVLSPEEINRYMYLVKAAAFSYNDFTEEEVWFCKTVYRKVLARSGEASSNGTDNNEK